MNKPKRIKGCLGYLSVKLVERYGKVEAARRIRHLRMAEVGTYKRVCLKDLKRRWIANDYWLFSISFMEDAEAAALAAAD